MSINKSSRAAKALMNGRLQAGSNTITMYETGFSGSCASFKVADVGTMIDRGRDGRDVLERLDGGGEYF